MKNRRTDFFTRYEKMSPAIGDYIESGGFSGLKKALGLPPERVTEDIENARLLGRGGAGFPTAMKWRGVGGGDEVFLVCNADEGEPGTFKDRYIMMNAPYLLLEGMLIAAHALGASRGFIYIRGEYPEVEDRLAWALEELESGEIAGLPDLKRHPFDIEIIRGGGSYVVGDETALLHSLMGYRGTPWSKPPFPTEKGLWDKPTVINNVETLACVALIMREGSRWFRSVGSPESPGPKLFCISGNIIRPGVYEMPMGSTVKELIDEAGGVDGDLKALQIGGTAGPVYDSRALSYKLDYMSMKGYGGILGSGAVVVMNAGVSMTELLEVEMRFFAQESCGRCFPCRYGTRQLRHMADRLAAGQGKEEYLDLILETAQIMNAASFCPFGKSLSLPVSTLLKGFGDEIRSRIREQRYLGEELR